MTHGEVTDFLKGYTKTGAPVSDLSRFGRLMERLGDPQDRLSFIHIAGTNGKGSTVRMISEALSRAEYITGEYTSPFIYRYNDRISVNGKEISDGELTDIAEKVITAVRDSEETGYSQFEITTAIAFEYFLRKKCDIVVLETGLGGLLDCTNIIKTNVCSVITSISYDHTAVLGNTIGEIAANKAGIIKEGSPCVTEYGNSEEALGVIRRVTEEKHSRLIIPYESSVRVISSGIDGNSFEYKGIRLETSMAGIHQITNAAAAYEALVCAKERGFGRISPESIYEGIKYAKVPSRCEVISHSPMTILDGAHNPDGMKKLSELVRSIDRTPKVMICGFIGGKDISAALSYISPLIDKAYCTDGFFPTAIPADELAGYFKNAECATLSEAYKKAVEYAGKDGLIVIGGSLYLASELKNCCLI